MTEEELKEIYNWVDEISLSRPKRNISRDFADAVLCAEIIAYYFPHVVELHNYSSVSSVDKKRYNWNTLSTKTLKKLHMSMGKKEIEDIITCQNEAIEKF